MKQCTVFQLGTFIFAFTGLIYCKPPEPEPDRVVQRLDTLTIAQVRALHTTLIPSTIWVTDANQEGTFQVDEADWSSDDNTGLTLVTSKGHRYKRSFSGAANLLWFGPNAVEADIGLILQTAVKATDEVFIPDGEYTQITPVHLKSNLTLKGNAGKVVINLPKSYVSLMSYASSGNTADDTISLEHVLIDGLTWKLTSKETSTYGIISIDGPSVHDLTVQNCASTDVAKDSTNWLTLKIQAGKNASDIVVRNNQIQSRRMACEVFNHDNYGIYAGKNITVSGNTFQDSWFGLSLSGPLDGLTIDNNYLRNCSHYGIEIAGAARNVAITGNRFEGVFDKFLEGSNDGEGNGSVTGGMTISGNSTVGLCQGGMQLYNGGTATFSKNNFRMTGMLELAHSTAGTTFTDNIIESSANKAIICDDSPNNTFIGNTISNKTCPGNQATFMAYGSKATNNILKNNRLIQGNSGKPYDAVEGGSCLASKNYDEAGNPIP